MNLKQLRDYYSNKEMEFVIKDSFMLNESEITADTGLKGVKELADIPINEPIKYNQNILIKGIKYGMIFVISYKGEEDDKYNGHERVIYPMVLGRSSTGNFLLRAWHLDGWSIGYEKQMTKIWRLFRTDRIISMTFTGSFFRLAPSGYHMNDKSMLGGIIAKADFNEIRRNQQTLINSNKIINKDEISMGDKLKRHSSILVDSTEYELDLAKPSENYFINDMKDKEIKITFMKSIYNSNYVAIFGALGQVGNIVKITDENKKNIGVFKVIESITTKDVKKIKRVKGNTKFKVYLFNKKL